MRQCIGKDKLFVLGYFGYKCNQIDGQTLKTRNLFTTIKNNSTSEVTFFDTYMLKKSKLYNFVLLYYLIRSNIIVMIPAHNMMKLLPILSVISRFRRSKIVYIPVGGWLSWYISDKPYLIRLLSLVEVILPQTQLQVNALQSMHGFRNVKYLPNYRIHNFVPKIKNSGKCFKIVFCARIHKMKGLDVVFSIAEYYKNVFQKYNIIIDFWGPINDDDNVYFKTEIVKYSFVQYRGILDSDNIYRTLSEYDVMIFPTRYIKEEGFPGSILDSYISGIPVITSDWCHSREFVDDNESGFICDINNVDTFIEKIKLLYNSPDILLQMKTNAYKKSLNYSEICAWNILKEYIF